MRKRANAASRRLLKHKGGFSHLFGEHRQANLRHAAIHRDSPGSTRQVVKDIHFRRGDRHTGFSQPLHIGSNTLDPKPEKPVKRCNRQPLSSASFSRSRGAFTSFAIC